MKLVTADQMRALEQRADASGNSYAAMMERAGKSVAATLAARMDPRAKKILALIGPGNNGGDGLVGARHLHDAGARVTLYVWKRVPRGDDENWRQCAERGIRVVRAEDDAQFSQLRELAAHADVIIDALLGAGIARPMEGLLKEILLTLKISLRLRVPASPLSLLPLRSPAPPRPFVVAVDLPSGLDPDTGALDPATLNADLTITFAFPKIGQLLFPGANAVGELIVAEIGIPAEWADDISIEVARADEIAAKLPARSRDSHKGTHGKALICAGSANYIGAAFLAGVAATRAGAGLVTLALPRALVPIIAAALHETTFVALPEASGAIAARAARIIFERGADYDARLIGPGLGRAAETMRFVRSVIASGAKQSFNWNMEIASSQKPRLAMTTSPLVIDADALYALAQTPGWWKKIAPASAILTPHPGEMATLTGLSRQEIQRDRIGVAKKFAAEWKQVVVLKGAHTVVAAPDGRATIIPFATPALATAGAGDVLAGTIVAMLAQYGGTGKPRPYQYDAAIVGAYMHGLAGKIAEEEIGEAGVVAGDLLTRLPRAWHRIAAR